jgi:low temperature requirement protein LtrA
MRLTALPIASHDKDWGWMMHVSNHGGGLLRARDEGEQPVMPFELFFDLVFIFAVIQLSHRLLEQLTTANALETLLLLLVVWSA